MPPLLERNDSRSIDGRFYARELISVLRTGIATVDLFQNFYVADELFRHKSHAAGEFAQNPFHLLFLVYGKGTELVIHFENLLGLDEESGSALGAVVNETLYVAFIFGADGKNIAVVAHRNNTVLQVLSFLPR